ncbi:cobalamin biosynthesis protein CbiX [Georgenia wutianyii]|uniref:Cobalamin biosynthesis protein CbiX n=1 Tax=Georgenia wutianyii TaxID=2585135 RepID=A0ABX5VLC6_9MICO|nr:cobalamin biosynthesis protein CbiX [Georgenia wutianyii]QDB79276.1 cobalamin biosynthesis protein CbiX [Georgenia wutianyii]
MAGGPGVAVYLVGGHESAYGRELTRFTGSAATIAEAATAPGRGLQDLAEDALASEQTVVAVPMTFGRDPQMVAETAKTLKWLSARAPGRVAVSAPFGTTDHLTTWLRAAANRAATGGGRTALLAVAPHSNPFDEAELHRLAYLVATYGALPEVHATIADDSAELAAAAARARALGAERVVAVPAGFAATLPDADVELAGPLVGEAAVARVVRIRVVAALAALVAGDDGIDVALAADHGHGYAHSHAGDEHPHTHADGTTHVHSHGSAHPHAHADHRPATPVGDGVHGYHQ